MTWLPPPRKHRPTTAERIEAAGRIYDAVMLKTIPCLLLIAGASIAYQILGPLIADEPTAIERME